MEYLVLGVVAVIFFLAVGVGYYKGLVNIVLSLVAGLVAFLLAVVLTAPISAIVKDSEVYDRMKDSVAESVCAGLTQDGIKINTLEDLVGQIQLPDSVSTKLAEGVVGTIEEDFEELGQVSVSELSSLMVEAIADFILELIVFLILFVLAYIVIRIVIMVIDLATKLPGLNLLNHVLGAALGAIHGIIIIWVASLILTVFASTGPGQQILQVVSDNAVLNWIYGHNLLWSLIMTIIH